MGKWTHLSDAGGYVYQSDDGAPVVGVKDDRFNSRGWRVAYRHNKSTEITRVELPSDLSLEEAMSIGLTLYGATHD